MWTLNAAGRAGTMAMCLRSRPKHAATPFPQERRIFLPQAQAV
jgi:hypothetical protein